MSTMTLLLMVIASLAWNHPVTARDEVASETAAAIKRDQGAACRPEVLSDRRVASGPTPG